MTRVLVTGGSGFVGLHLTAELVRAGYETIATSLTAVGGDAGAGAADPTDGVTWRQLDLEDVDAADRLVGEVRPEVVLHLAAQSNVARAWTDPVATWRANVLGTVSLCQALTRHRRGARLVNIGSGDIYGSVAADALPIREECPPRPNNPYSASKLAAEIAAAQFGRAGGLEVVLLRPFAHTGPGQSPDFACPSFARQIARIEAGLQPPRLRVGNLEARRDLTDVRDMVAAYVAALERAPVNEPLNICSGRSHRVGDLLRAMLAMSGRPIEIEPDRERMRPVDTPEIRGDASRFRATTGWAPRIPIEQTLAGLLDDCRARARDAVTSSAAP